MKKSIAITIALSFVLISILPATHCREPLDNNIVGSWNCNEGTGSLIHDSSTYGNDGTIYGPSWSHGADGQSLSFDGINDYALISNDDSLNFADTNQFTISMWVNRESTSIENSEVLISKATSLYKQGYIIRIPTNNTVRFYFMDGSSTFSVYSQTELEESNWYHIVAVWNGTTSYIYINGILDNSKMHGTVNIQDDYKPLEFGNHYGYTDNNYPYHGKMDEVILYDRALEENEVQDLYQQYMNGPVAIWHFDEGNGVDAYDSSVHNNHGIINGANWTTGLSNTALLFDGIDDTIIVDDSSSLSFGYDDFSVCAWINTDNGINEKIQIIEKMSRVGSTPYTGFYVRVTDDDGQEHTVEAYISDGISDIETYSTSTVNDGDWHFITVTYNRSSDLSVYIDGYLESSGDISTIDDINTSHPLYIGQQDNGDNTFNGMLDEIIIYDRVLPSNEITQLYHEIISIDVEQLVQDRGFPIRHALDGDWGAAQSFVPESVTTITGNAMYLRKFGTPEFNLTVELRTDHPQGTLIDTLVLIPEEIPTDWDWVTLDFADTTVTPDVEYFIVCPPAPSGVTTSFGYEWGYAFGNQYDDGAFWFTRDGGGLWRDLPTMYEFCFKTYGYD